jgi:hypothetical protein
MKTKKITIASLLWFLIVLSAYAQNESRLTAFIGVNVIPMDKEHVLSNQTVIVQDNKIKEMGDEDKIKLPAGAILIHAKGSFLIPGLVDMNAKLPDGSADEISMHDYLLLNVLRGVTSIRSMPGDLNGRKMRDSIRRNEVIGPDLYLGSPLLPKEKDFNAQKAEILFDQFKQENYSFVTFLNPLRPILYDSVMHIARDKGLKVSGICPPGGLMVAATQGQGSIEHLDAFIQEYTKDSTKFKTTISELVKNKVYVCPTIQWSVINDKQLSVLQLNRKPGTQYLPLDLIKTWREPFEKDYALHNNTKENKQKYIKKRMARQASIEKGLKIIKAMQEAGVPLLISPGDGYFIIPGFGLIEECRDFVDAGISPFETLKAATVNASSFFGESDRWGTIAPEKKADLVLLEDNPLSDIGNLEKIKGVMLRGHWYSKEDLDRMRTDVCKKNQRDTEEALQDKIIRENKGRDNNTVIEKDSEK